MEGGRASQAEVWEQGKVAKRSLAKAFEVDEDGVLTLEEFVSALTKSDPTLTHETCRSMFDMLDEDKNGTLSEKEVGCREAAFANDVSCL